MQFKKTAKIGVAIEGNIVYGEYTGINTSQLDECILEGQENANFRAIDMRLLSKGV